MDEDNNNVLTRRGSYKRYLQDDNVPVPESTIRSRIQREQMSLQQVSLYHIYTYDSFHYIEYFIVF